jgi:flagellar biosynthetic protein FliR
LHFTIEYLEYALLVVVRVASIILVAPFFNINHLPRKYKVGLAVFLSIIVFHLVDYQAVKYTGVIGFTILVLKESITGLMIGIGSGVCLYILNFSGEMLDMEIGFSMAMELDPTTNVQSTISSKLFNALFMLMFIVSDMHYFVIDAMYDSYQMIPIGGAHLKTTNLLKIFMIYMADFFSIGFRIILPLFACTLLLNVVLGVLAKIAPQMNMFVIGMQLKVFVGLFLLFIIMAFLPGITDFVFQEMQRLTHDYMNSMAP